MFIKLYMLYCYYNIDIYDKRNVYIILTKSNKFKNYIYNKNKNFNSLFIYKN